MATYLSLTTEMSISALLTQANHFLEASLGTIDKIEVYWILSEVLSYSLSELRLYGQKKISKDKLELFQQAILRRSKGEPLQYILGNVPFYNLNLKVGPGVLIPRPETEELVEYAIQQFSNLGVILDLCTGSGAIALALAQAYPNVAVHATDLSPQALEYAKQNAQHHCLEHVKFYLGDLLSPVMHLKGKVEILTANPPYISLKDYQLLEHEVIDFEPSMALTDQADGLTFIKRIASEAHDFLLKSGTLFCEIGEDQGEPSRQIFSSYGWSEVKIIKDLTKRDRIIFARP